MTLARPGSGSAGWDHIQARSDAVEHQWRRFEQAHLCPKLDHQGAGLSFPPGSGLPACGMCAPVCDALALFGDMTLRTGSRDQDHPVSWRSDTH